jgi:hypothetical protein
LKELQMVESMGGATLDGALAVWTIPAALVIPTSATDAERASRRGDSGMRVSDVLRIDDELREKYGRSSIRRSVL